jgi:N-acetylmuramoyl-L-alanine amidase
MPFGAALMDRLEALMGELMARWQIPPQNVIGHSDMAPERKFDPGARFDWQRLARQGLAVTSVTHDAGGSPDPQAFARAAQGFGYPEAPVDDLLAAVRHRTRPAARGPLDGTDMARITDLARRFPVDPAAPAA